MSNNRLVEDKGYLRSLVEADIIKFLQADAHLVDVNSSERSMTHSIAVIMSQNPAFKGWNIDCEYSRHGDEVKRLSLPPKSTSSDELEAKTVYPDVIIHKRNSDENLLVIEAKKSSASQDYDEKKIKGYMEQLGYINGLLLTIPRSSDGEPKFKWFPER